MLLESLWKALSNGTTFVGNAQGIVHKLRIFGLKMPIFRCTFLPAQGSLRLETPTDGKYGPSTFSLYPIYTYDGPMVEPENSFENFMSGTHTQWAGPEPWWPSLEFPSHHHLACLITFRLIYITLKSTQ